MAKINRFNGNLKAFASESTGTNRTLFGEVTQADDLTSQVTADFKLGWQIVGPSDQPSLQDFNAAMYTHGQLLAYLHQAGVPEFNALQEYFNGSITNRLGSLYRCRTATHVSATVPENDPTNWRFLSGGQTITGTTTFTNATNSIFLPGIGSIGLEVGDVIQVTNTADNDNLFTVEVITNANNIIVNQAHAGGTTTKSLRAETADAIVRLISKWYNAPIGLGQGPVNVTASRAKTVGYTNNTNRSISSGIRLTNTPGGGGWRAVVIVAGITTASTMAVSGGESLTELTSTLNFQVPPGASYILDIAGTGGSNANLNFWIEIR